MSIKNTYISKSNTERNKRLGKIHTKCLLLLQATKGGYEK